MIKRLFNRNDNIAILIAGIFSIIIGLGVARLCGTGYTSQRNPTDKKRVGTYSQSENKRNSNS
jgi:dolichol kinase